MVANGGPIEVFYSYSHKDERLRDKLENHLSILKRQKVIAGWHDRKITAGNEWAGKIDEHLDSAAVILLLISDEFLASDYCYDVELKRAMERHEAGEARVIPVILRPCLWEGASFGKLQALPKDAKAVTRWRLRDDAWKDVATGIKNAIQELRGSATAAGPDAAAPGPARPTASLPPIWNVPRLRNPNFTGRNAQLEELHTKLASHTTTALTALRGTGGVGKTQLATEYAFRHASDYEAVWWVRSNNAAQFASDYAALAIAVGAADAEEADQEVQIAAAKAWLEHNGGWLLVLDNVPHPGEIEAYLPSGGTGDILITSRFQNWGGVADTVSVDTWPRDDSIDFLLSRTGLDDRDSAGKLAEELGDLPLALEHAGAYVEETGCSLSGYLELFKQRRGDMIALAKPPPEYDETVATTWGLSFDMVAEESPAAVDLLNLCAFLAPDDIPLDIIREGAEHLPKALATAAADDLTWNVVLAALRKYSLVEVSGDALYLHRLIQAVVRGRLSDDARRASTEGAVTVLDRAFPFDSDFPEEWPVCTRLAPHAFSACGHGEDLNVSPSAVGRLLNQLGLYLNGRAQYAEGRAAFERALKIDEAAFGPDDSRVAADLSNLGSALSGLDDHQGARSHFERALQIGKAALGPDDPKVGKFHGNLAKALVAVEDLEGAKGHVEHALSIHEKTYGAEHPDVGTSHNILGAVLARLNDLEGARMHFERALEIHEVAYGPDHLDVAMDVGSIGGVLLKQGDPAGARLYLARALDIIRSSLGDDHPKTVAAQSFLESLND